MAKGYKTGGRKKGTPNKATSELKSLLEGFGYDPIAEMVELAQDPETSKELKQRIASEFCQYLYPKRKAIDVSGEMSVTLEDYLLDDDS